MASLYDLWWNTPPFTVSLYKPARTTVWSYFVSNGAGGGGGSCQRGSRKLALFIALRSMPPGTKYRLEVNGKDMGEHVKAVANG